jgi:eukaryotic-like serine/threonine-protein kinase
MRPLAPTDPTDLGGYRLRGRLGAGGMGTVYLASTPGGRPVALKVMRSELSDDGEFRERFRGEIAAARKVHGLYTAELLDADPDATPAWLVTAYVAGPSLGEAVAARGPVPAGLVPLLMAGVAEALEAIHAAGVVHRDLKPSNVLLSSDGPRVIDFGIARALDGVKLTTTGATMGSPHSMTPEQARGLPMTPALDVFALGSLAAFAALGRSPFDAGNPAAVMFRVLFEEPDLEGCPPHLRPLLERCLDKDPASRPSPAEIIRACRAMLPGDPTGLLQAWLAVTGSAGEGGTPSPYTVADPVTPEATPVTPVADPSIHVGDPPSSVAVSPAAEVTPNARAGRAAHQSHRSRPAVTQGWRRRLAIIGACAAVVAAADGTWALLHSAAPPRPTPAAENTAPTISRASSAAALGHAVASPTATASPKVTASPVKTAPPRGAAAPALTAPPTAPGAGPANAPSGSGAANCPRTGTAEISATCYTQSQGKITVTSTGDPSPAGVNGSQASELSNGDYLEYPDIDFGSGQNYFLSRVACGAPSGDSGGVEVVLDNPGNTPVAGFSLGNTGGWSSWQSVGANMSEVSGIHNVYIVLASGGPIPYMSLHYFTFS